MTSLTTSPESAVARPPGLALRFSGVVRAEWIKLTSLRSVRITLIVSVLAGLGLSSLIALAFSGSDLADGIPTDAASGVILMVATSSGPFLALILGVLGVLAISSEYSSGMILSTLAAVPRRTPVLFAKAAVLAAISAVTAFAVVLGGVLIAVAVFPDAAGALTSSTVLSGALGTVAYLALFVLFAFGIAGLLRSTAGSIAVVAGVAFVLPIAVNILGLTGWDWVPGVASLLPDALGGTLSQGVGDAAADVASALGGPSAEQTGPGFWGALLAMTAWAAIPVAGFAWAFQTRDAR